MMERKSSPPVAQTTILEVTSRKNFSRKIGKALILIDKKYLRG